MKNKNGFTLIEVFVCMAIIGILVSMALGVLQNNSACEKLVKKGYNRSEVSVFLRGTPYTCQDLCDSKALQVQYKAFLNGDTSFVNSARATKAAKDADNASTAASSAMLLGTGAMMLNSSN